MNIATLRHETRQDHDKVESVMPLMHPDLNRDLYIAVLRRLYGIVSAWERQAETELPMRLRHLAQERNRLNFLRMDLDDFGAEVLDLSEPRIPRFNNLAELLGGMYVMEGSRLGGQLIARHVESALGLSAGNGTRYFRGFGDATGQRWKELITVLESEIPDESSADSVRGAKQMFAAFGEWMSAIMNICS